MYKTGKMRLVATFMLCGKVSVYDLSEHHRGSSRPTLLQDLFIYFSLYCLVQYNGTWKTSLQVLEVVKSEPSYYSYMDHEDDALW